MYHLFLDDIRTPDMIYQPKQAQEFIVVRSYTAFVAYIQENGLPQYISFDNDLGQKDLRLSRK